MSKCECLELCFTRTLIWGNQPLHSNLWMWYLDDSCFVELPRQVKSCTRCYLICFHDSKNFRFHTSNAVLAFQNLTSLPSKSNSASKVIIGRPWISDCGVWSCPVCGWPMCPKAVIIFGWLKMSKWRVPLKRHQKGTAARCKVAWINYIVQWKPWYDNGIKMCSSWTATWDTWSQKKSWVKTQAGFLGGGLIFVLLLKVATFGTSVFGWQVAWLSGPFWGGKHVWRVHVSWLLVLFVVWLPRHACTCELFM